MDKFYVHADGLSAPLVVTGEATVSFELSDDQFRCIIKTNQNNVFFKLEADGIKIIDELNKMIDNQKFVPCAEANAKTRAVSSLKIQGDDDFAYKEYDLASQIRMRENGEKFRSEVRTIELIEEILLEIVDTITQVKERYRRNRTRRAT